MGRYYIQLHPTRINLGTPLVNIFLCDLFLEHENNYFINYADDTTPYMVGNNTNEVLADLSHLSQSLFTQFANNQLKANQDKCHLLLKTQEAESIQLVNATISNSRQKKLLGINLDNNLKFDLYIENICQKASRKLKGMQD